MSDEHLKYLLAALPQGMERKAEEGNERPAS